MNIYEVWVEGYIATGERDKAQQLKNLNRDDNKWEANDFKSACLLAIETLKWDLNYYNKDNNSYWACKFYDNEKDARKNYG
jgi:hypothetical protein